MTTTRYITGFILSLLVTCMSFGLVWAHMAKDHALISHSLLAMLVLALAIVQLAVQLIYFLHVGRESKTRDILSLILAGFLIVFIVIGSLWIMANLQLNHGLPYQGDITPQTATN
jgi:cytochrome o ubiquinol oxidase operon protein cyoD